MKYSTSEDLTEVKRSVHILKKGYQSQKISVSLSMLKHLDNPKPSYCYQGAACQRGADTYYIGKKFTSLKKIYRAPWRYGTFRCSRSAQKISRKSRHSPS